MDAVLVRHAEWDPLQAAANRPASSSVTPEDVVYAEDPRHLTTDVRESVSRCIQRSLPGPLARLAEAFVTWVSGCPHDGERPLVRRSKGWYTLEAFGGYLMVLALGYVVVHSGWWALTLPLLWLLMAGRAWALFNIFHHATHKTLFESEPLNRALAFGATVLAFSSSLDAYREQHIYSHHTKAMCTYDDKEAAFMDLGMPPGRDKGFYYRRLWRMILSPAVYLAYARYRLWDWQKEEPLSHRLALWGFAAGLTIAAVATDELPFLVLGVVIPLFVVFNVTGLLGTFSEHHWGGLIGYPAKVRLVLLNQGRLLLDPAPAAEVRGSARLRAWLRWWARFLGYHLPVRVAVLPGDSMHHDHHHRHPVHETWTLSTFERYDHIAHGCHGFAGYPHTHAWSLGEAIDRVFTRMAAAPPPR